MALGDDLLRPFDAVPNHFIRRTTSADPLPPSFPLDIMDRYPSLVDMSVPITEESDTSHIRLADGVAAFLAKYDHSFKVQFFDLENANEFFRRDKKELYESTELIIRRNVNVVTVGWCTLMLTEPEVINGVLRKRRLFKDYETIVQFCIQDAGDWTPMAAQDEMTDHEWNHDPQMVEIVGSKVAKMLLVRREWEYEPGVTIKTSTDNVLERVGDEFQPTDSSSKRASELFRDAEQKGDTIQLSAACTETFAEQIDREAKEKADIAADQANKHRVVKARSRTFRDRFTHNGKSKEDVSRAGASIPEVGAQPMDRLEFLTSALEMEDNNGQKIDDSSVQAPVVDIPAANIPDNEGHVVKKRSTMDSLFAQSRGMTIKKAASKSSLVFQTNTSDVENTDGHVVGDSIVQVPGAETPATNTQVFEGRVMKKRTIEDMFAEAWGIRTKKSRDTFVQGHDTEAPVTKIHAIEGQVVRKRTIEDLFAQAWGAMTIRKTKAKAKGDKVTTNTSTDDRYIVNDPITAHPVRTSSKTKPGGIEEYNMEDLGRAI